MELNVTHGTFKTLKVHVSALHYDHIRWRQLYCVCKVTSTVSSSPCSRPFICSSLLSLRWNSLWKHSLECIRWSKFWVHSHMFGYIHMCSHMFGSEVDISQPYLTRKTTITQSLSHSIYKLNHQPGFYFNSISKPHTRSIPASCSQSKHQKIRFRTEKMSWM